MTIQNFNRMRVWTIGILLPALLVGGGRAEAEIDWSAVRAKVERCQAAPTLECAQSILRQALVLARAIADDDARDLALFGLVGVQARTKDANSVRQILGEIRTARTRMSSSGRSRGNSGLGRGRLRIPGLGGGRTARKAGGGGIGFIIIVLIVSWFLGINPLTLLQGGGDLPIGQQGFQEEAANRQSRSHDKDFGAQQTIGLNPEQRAGLRHRSFGNSV